ncbi:lipase [Metarhizium guizhouense ARSEF 977]|uniref:Lipase n=1 Tax=Metarhizium guizhouense (strain ARSEF 977) TaxID=1276136 RepID=A0A0B4H1F4_METGA|nr:lipase [Metarhizium guizhouense ARSEF 977]
MHLSTKHLGVLLGVVAATSAEIASQEFLQDIDTYARYAAFGYCDNLTDGKDINSGTKVCPSDGGIPHGCGQLADSVVVMEFPSAEGVSGFVAVNDEKKQIVVSFRGTGSAKDAITDLKTCKTRSGRSFWDFVSNVAQKVGDEINKHTRNTIVNIVGAACSLVGESQPDNSDALLPLCQDCRLHTGFFEGFKGIKNKMLTTVQQQKTAHPDFQVVVTGYSLGAAVATLSAAYLRKATFELDLYTYGSPRVGDAKFAEFVTNQGHGKNFRITNANDPVTNVPWADPDFAHVSPEYWFPKGIATKEMQVCNGVSNLGCSGQFDFKVQDVTLGKERMKPHLWPNYAVGFPFTGATACPGRGGRELDDVPFTPEEIAEMKRLADQSN